MFPWNQHIPLISNYPAQIIAKRKEFSGNTIIIVPAYFKRFLQRLLYLEIEPVFEGHRDKLHGYKEEYDCGQQRERHKGQYQLGPQFCPHCVLFSLKQELNEVSHCKKKEKKEP